MLTAGMDENEVREFLEREIARQESRTAFYWESQETEELLDLIVGLLAKLVEANNRKVERDLVRGLRG